MRRSLLLSAFVLPVAALLGPLARAQCDADELLPDDPTAEARFGGSVAVHGATLLVGAPFDDEAGAQAGAAYVFVHDGSGWVQQAKLMAGDAAPGARFGAAVALHGGTAVIGADGDGEVAPEAGAVYVFEWDGAAWVQEEKLLAADGQEDDRLGQAVALDLDTLVAGACQHWAPDFESGSAYVFVRDAGGWQQEAELVPADTSAGDHFGAALDVAGDLMLVGAPLDDDAGSSSGSAYVFHRTAGAWSQVTKLVAGDADVQDRFGSAVALSSALAVVGAAFDDDAGERSGAVYVFGRQGAVWLEEAKLVPADASDFDQVGTSVALDGDTLLVGAPGAEFTHVGVAYEFRRAEGAWPQTAKMETASGQLGDGFGSALSLDGAVALIGAPQADPGGDDAGAAYLMGACPCQLATYCQTSPNSAGPGALIGWNGEPSLSANSFELTGSDLPPSQPALFFFGPLQEEVPFGDGVRCVGGPPLVRLDPPAPADGAGFLTRPLDLQAPPFDGFAPGDATNFQLWYRDPAAGGAGFNFSDALAVTFCL